MDVVTIRPEPGADSTVEYGRRKGLLIHAFPLSEVKPVVWNPPPPEDFDALLVGSANVFRHAGPALRRYELLPVHAVGETTAQAARQAGLRVERVGEGGLQKVIDSVPGPLRYLRLAGTEHVPLKPPSGTTIDLHTVYKSVNLPIGRELEQVLRDDALVLLHSAGAAQHLRAECDRLDIDRAGISLATLGPRICEAAGSGWARIKTASQPRESALLALAADMCH